MKISKGNSIKKIYNKMNKNTIIISIIIIISKLMYFGIVM
jgi:hypothetical protein